MCQSNPCRLRITLRGWIALILLCSLIAPLAPLWAEDYQRNVGLLPEAKAEADALRMVEIIKEFQKTRLKGDCINSYDRQGLDRLYQLKDEEGRDSNPPRTGYETELYRRIKAAAARGEGIDQEWLLRNALEASIDRKGAVNLQDVFLTIHNVTRLLARPETWWVDHWKVSGAVLPGFLGGGEVTSGKWAPGWRGLKDDPMYPIVRDIFGDAPVEGEGSGQPTLAEMMGALEYEKDDPSLSPEQRAHRDEQLQKMREKQQADLVKKQKLLKDLQAQLKAEKGASARKLLEQRIGYLTQELAEPDISTRVLNKKYTADLFDLPNEYGEKGGVFKPLYGAKDGLGNGGGYYYFWLGALARSSVGIGAEAGAGQYERMQKWLGSEQEYARGLMQVSHFHGGGALGEAAQSHSADCSEKKDRGPIAGGTVQLDPPFQPGFVTSEHQQQDWYCTNRPLIESPVSLPSILEMK